MCVRFFHVLYLQPYLACGRFCTIWAGSPVLFSISLFKASGLAVRFGPAANKMLSKKLRITSSNKCKRTGISLVVGGSALNRLRIFLGQWLNSNLPHRSYDFQFPLISDAERPFISALRPRPSGQVLSMNELSKA